MKPTPNSETNLPGLLVFGAHPDDIEFGCGAIVCKETAAGRRACLVICSRGESGTHGTPEVRMEEAGRGARIMGAALEFCELDGDGLLEARREHAIRLAGLIREHRPGIVLAPTPVENQHPDHARLGALVRDAARLARYGGIGPLKHLAPHAIDQLLLYAVGPEGEMQGQIPVMVDVSEPPIIAAWTAAMEAHASQLAARNYVELQLTRARLNGLRAGVPHAMALYPSDPVLVGSLAQIARAARRF